MRPADLALVIGCAFALGAAAGYLIALADEYQYLRRRRRPPTLERRLPPLPRHRFDFDSEEVSRQIDALTHWTDDDDRMRELFQ